MNFIHGVPEHLYINHPNQLVIGQYLWRVGQGGSVSLTKPYLEGFITHIGKEKYGSQIRNDHRSIIINHNNTLVTRSMLDTHIVSDQTYNNWYVCTNEQNAWDIYHYMQTYIMCGGTIKCLIC